MEHKPPSKYVEYLYNMKLNYGLLQYTMTINDVQKLQCTSGVW